MLGIPRLLEVIDEIGSLHIRVENSVVGYARTSPLCHPQGLLTAFRSAEFVVDLVLDPVCQKMVAVVVDKFEDWGLEIGWNYKVVESHMVTVERQNSEMRLLDTLG